MAGQGRKAMPTSLKLVKGERADRINDDEPKPQEGIPECPSNDPCVVEVWDYVVKQLVTMRVLTMADRDVLHAYCEAVMQHRRASRQLLKDGLTVRTETGVRKHPAQAIQREAAAAMRSLATEFGLTPAARTRIKVADQQPAKEQGAGRLLSG